MTELRVELYGAVVGSLTGERERFDFAADEAAVARYGALSPILSVSVPLTRRPNPRSRALRQNFFEEILAEGRIRERLGRNARLDSENTMGLLHRYGRDVAGAVQIWDPADPHEPRTPASSPVSDRRIAEMLAEVALNPLGNNGRRRLSSLAGVQDKVLLVRTDSGWSEPLDGYPSTHIIKPLAAQRTLIFDEEYGSRFARALGLASFATTIEAFDDVRALVIQRYDRDGAGGRSHQEDFNQVLGYRGDEKYEPREGDARLRRIAGVLRAHASTGDLRNLLRMTTLSLAVGNLDMHSKNISLLHDPEGEVALAPMYDVVPQLHLEVDTETALQINGKSDYFAISGRDLVEEGESWGVRDAAIIVSEALEQIQDVARCERQLPGAHHSLQSTVIMQSGRLLDGLARGDAPSPQTSVPVSEVFIPRSAPGGWGGPVGKM
jgi:serine/threonine-protein kinase HipA